VKLLLTSSFVRFARATVPSLDFFVILVGAIGLFICGHSLYRLPFTPYPLSWLAVGALGVIAGYFPLKVPGVPVYLSISDTFFITSAVLFGPAPATVSIALDTLVMSWRRGNAAHQVLFNTAACAISLWAAANVFFGVAGRGPLVDEIAPPGARTLIALACLAAVYFSLNSGLVATAIARQRSVRMLTLGRQHFAVVGITHFAAASASFFFIVLTNYASPLAIAALLPLVAIFYLAMRSSMGRLDDAQQHVATVNRLYLSTVSALSTAIEAKDGVTSDHIHRVQSRRTPRGSRTR